MLSFETVGNSIKGRCNVYLSVIRAWSFRPENVGDSTVSTHPRASGGLSSGRGQDDVDLGRGEKGPAAQEGMT